MFAVDEGHFLIAKSGDTREHREWLISIFGQYPVAQFYETTTRGYWLEERLMAYAGSDFSDKVDHTCVKKAIEMFQSLGFEIKKVGIGAIPGEDQPWKPKKEYTIQEYLASQP